MARHMENLLICSISLTNDKKLENVHIVYSYICISMKGVALIRALRGKRETGRGVTGKSTAQHKLA